jgi:hypothetical protein
MKKIFILLLTGFTHFMVAAQFLVEYGNNITISQPVYKDMYLMGGNITINAPIYGDLIVAGGTILINDTITNDILLAGGNVTFNGYVGDDIRCAGGNIRISKNVAGDLVITGGSVIIDKTTTIGGLLASGGDVTVDGNINGEIKGVFGNLFLNGGVTKNIDCRGGKITVNGTIDGNSILAASSIIIGNNASFRNDVRFWNTKGTIDFKQSLNNAKATYDPSLSIQSGRWYYLGAASLVGLLWWLGMALLMIFLVQYLFAETMKKSAETAFNKTLKSVGIGFLYFIAVPVATIVAFITVIGVPVGILLLFGYIALFLLATVITSVVSANWFNNYNNSKWKTWQLVLAAFGIFIFLKLVSATPFVGGLIMVVLVAMTFGSILLTIRWRKRQATIAG